ncbi:hypothetical protein F4808DRAFT_422894 [Astrocystis sublimbata]|nr:hypothetical protein F4808DRAFT_422894 [Astrocystis sublimbata]
MRRKLTLDYRRPSDARSRADSNASQACQAIMRDLGRDASAYSKKVFMIQLHRYYAYFGSDVFLGDSSVQPSCDVSRKTIGLSTRSTIAVTCIACDGTRLPTRSWPFSTPKPRHVTKGGLPYFQDRFTRAIYDDGVLVEDPEQRSIFQELFSSVLDKDCTQAATTDGSVSGECQVGDALSDSGNDDEKSLDKQSQLAIAKSFKNSTASLVTTYFISARVGNAIRPGEHEDLEGQALDLCNMVRIREQHPRDTDM